MQNDEDARAAFGNLSCKTMTLPQIAHRRRKVAEHMCREEFLEDKHCEKNTTNLKSGSSMEKEAECLYTRLIFRVFQEELINHLSLAMEKSGGKVTLRKFKLTEKKQHEDRHRQV
ncbi:hypothetical protein ACJRO7_011304 [Eucalyptus globulus]|uniref:Uncharacterized protein n=1 Tax=Eucalyptus globulus TaxID=34317 RepID=A0ABD3LPK0_EUCGL